MLNAIYYFRLYNKDAILEYLLDKQRESNGKVKHIKGNSLFSFQATFSFKMGLFFLLLKIASIVFFNHFSHILKMPTPLVDNKNLHLGGVKNKNF